MDDYPLMNLFFTMLWFFLFVAWIWLLIAVVGDIFRSRDLSGWAKALWTLVIVVVPVLGALAYLVARGGSMAERTFHDHRRRQEEFESYVREVATTPVTGTAGELAELARLRDAGTITAFEFESQKAKILA